MLHFSLCVGDKNKYLQVVQRTKNGFLGTDGEMSRIHSVLSRRRWNAYAQMKIHIEKSGDFWQVYISFSMYFLTLFVSLQTLFCNEEHPSRFHQMLAILSARKLQLIWEIVWDGRDSGYLSFRSSIGVSLFCFSFFLSCLKNFFLDDKTVRRGQAPGSSETLYIMKRTVS